MEKRDSWLFFKNILVIKYLDTNDVTDENIELTKPIDFDYFSDESLRDDINYDPAMDAFSVTNNSGVEQQLDRRSRYLSSIHR